MLSQQVPVIILEGEKPQHRVPYLDLRGICQLEGQVAGMYHLDAVAHSKAELPEIW